MKNQVLHLALIIVLLGCGKEPAPAPGPLPAAPPGLPGAAAGVPVAAALAGFEGQLDLLARFGGATQARPPISVTIKGAKLRFSLPEGTESFRHLGQHVHVIVNTADKKLMAVIDDKQQVIVVQLDQLGEQMKAFVPQSAQGTKEAPTPPQLKKTGRTDTVAGYACQEWEVIMQQGGRALLCVADQGASWLQLPTAGLPAEHAWARELFDGHHLPLRVVTFDEKGSEAARVEITKLDRHAISDAVFEAPTSYRTVDMAQMMKGLGGAGLKLSGATGAPSKAQPTPVDLQDRIEKMRARMKAGKAAQAPSN